jgi:uncharacterized integral membrane protein (TIGR00698 family)
MNLEVVGRVGAHGILYTVISLSAAILLGVILGKSLKIDQTTSMLISAGTAICGGSAIAAIAPVLRAKSTQVSVSLATVFCLNAVALVIFPPIGHHFNLTEQAFGLWSALAIHDTSSVVGASLQYGHHALEVRTTVKLARDLWIIPLTLVVGMLWKSDDSEADASGAKPKGKKPWFILGFLIAAALVTWVPALNGPGHIVADISKRALVFTLFLIGSGLTRATIKAVGIRPFLQGLALWIVMASGTLFAITQEWIQ